MAALAASHGIVVVVGAALIVVGIGFAGYAIMLALLPSVGEIEAAAITGGGMLIIPFGYLAVAALRTPSTAVPARTVIRTETAMLGALATVARERPVLAVLAAALLGGADVLLRNRK